jgi:hypothetical protein
MKDEYCEEKTGKGGCDALQVEKSAFANHGRSEGMKSHHASKADSGGGGSAKQGSQEAVEKMGGY